MKRFLLVAAMVLMAPGASYGKSNILERSGPWTAFHVDVGNHGNPIYGMMTTGSDGRIFMVKYQANGGVFVQFAKSSWRFKPGVEVNVWIRFDTSVEFPGVAVSEVTAAGNHQLLAVTIKSSSEANFLHEFGESKQITIGFPDGDEQLWVANMTGSP